METIIELFKENVFMFVLTIVYISVFIIMLFLTLIVSIVNKCKKKQLQRNINKYIELIRNESESVNNDKTVSNKHKRYIGLRLRDKKFLEVIDGALHILSNEDKEFVERYVFAISEPIAMDVKHFHKKSLLYRSYFAYLMSEYPLNPEFEQKTVLHFLLSNLELNSIYCRENSLMALALLGNEQYLIDGLKVVSKSQYILQTKLLTECLIAFTGDKQNLSVLLWDNFKSFKTELKVAIINFVKFNNNSDDLEYVYAYLRNETNEEVVYSCIRYFGKYPFVPALRYMHELGAEALENGKWGYVAVISTAYQIYRSRKAVNFLMKAVSSPDWQSRENAAKTLTVLFGEKAFAFVENCKDKYANEMVRYVLDNNYILAEAEKMGE